MENFGNVSSVNVVVFESEFGWVKYWQIGFDPPNSPKHQNFALYGKFCTKECLNIRSFLAKIFNN